MSPELTLRPSLSGPAWIDRLIAGGEQRVAGANAPAFVERAGGGELSPDSGKRVSPELTLRPSLSGIKGKPNRRAMKMVHTKVSPELTLRPSLSDP